MTTKIPVELDTLKVAARRLVPPVVLVLMGVSGSGKTTIALELHRVLRWPFQEGIHDRILRRQHPNMPPSLLHSQFETLEEPGEDEHPIIVTVACSVTQTVSKLLERLANAER